MDLYSLLVLLLSCGIQASGARLTLSPQTLTVLRGDEAAFTCSTTSPKWTVMIWMINSRSVLTISREVGPLPAVTPNVTAEKVPDSNRDSWMFILKGTERQNQGEVTCDLQGIEIKTAALFVQEKGTVQLFGGERMAFQGMSVHFQCQASGWYPQPTVQWHVNDRKASQSEYNISSVESGESLFTVTSNLNVTAVKSSEVDCRAFVSALPTHPRSSVRLTVVAEVVEEGDWCTVPLAVTGSLAALLLLLLLGLCTVLWFRQRRQAKAKPRESVRIAHLGIRAFDQSMSAGGSVAEATRDMGSDNLGYSGDDPTDPVYNELNTETGSQMDSVHFRKVPDVVSSSSASLHTGSQAHVCLSDEGSKNIRRITTV